MKISAKRFILIDDDPINNIFSLMVLKKSLGDNEIMVFKHPEMGLDYIEAEFCFKNRVEETILFLDINMPTMTGWEFLEKFETFPNSVKNQFKIYMLSSTVDLLDIERAKSNRLVVGFLEKPLKKILLTEMFGKATND
ncbi:response regulator [Flavobacterium sp.]|uniref:response regulator n=1 Tax=Flavobacterium sp. TaxID=239 RepID=UPI00286BF032|nr:response regulator [Flavobacterium sp.]